MKITIEVDCDPARIKAAAAAAAVKAAAATKRGAIATAKAARTGFNLVLFIGFLVLGVVTLAGCMFILFEMSSEFPETNMVRAIVVGLYVLMAGCMYKLIRGIILYTPIVWKS